MKRIFSSGRMWICVAAFALIACGSVGQSSAYFTSYASAQGSVAVELGTQTKIHETFSDWTKHVTVTNIGDVMCFVRVKAFSGSVFELVYSDPNGLWSPGEDGYWYYSEPLQPGESAKELLVQVTLPEEQISSFHVIVVQECTCALVEGSTYYADWTSPADSKSEDFSVGGTES